MLSNKMMDKSFEFSEGLWVDNKWSTSREIEKIKNRISHLKRVVETEVSNDPRDCEGYTEFHHQRYTLECIVGECNISLTAADVEKMINFSFLRILYYRIFNRKLFRLVTKVRNMYRITNKLFPSSFLFRRCSLDDFDVNFVKAVHREVGRGIINNAGDFRKTCAAPIGYSTVQYEYMQPHVIEENLEQLLRECRLVFSQPELKFLDVIKYGACFLEKFLAIHPFSNGNGRTARLLLSRLLQQHTIVPLSLYTSGEKRKLYLHCLSEARYGDNKPSLLARFILEAIEREYELYCYVMDADTSNFEL